MIPLFKVHMPESVVEPVKNVLMSGYVGQGPKVDEFEKKLTPWVGHPNGLTVNSCTSAIHLALRLAGVGPGKEVISTPMTCSATNEPILERGADIVWADISPLDGNIDTQDVERKITKKTKAIICVHWAGYPCDLGELSRISQKYGIPVIEDAAHAFGAEHKGRRIGSHSQYVCFSFQAIKHLTTVDGGLLVCASMDDYRRGKLLRWYGIDRETPRRDLRCEEDIKEYGYKAHMNDLAAVIGIEQLNHMAGLLKRHRENAAFYRENLSGIKGVLQLHYRLEHTPSFWIYTILVKDRVSFQKRMADEGVMVSQVHIRNDIHTAFRGFERNLPGVDEFSEQQVSIPVGWWVTDEDRVKVVEAIKKWSEWYG